MAVHLNRKQIVIYGPLSYGIHKKCACFVSDTHFIIQGNRICAGFRLKGIQFQPGLAEPSHSGTQKRSTQGNGLSRIPVDKGQSKFSEWRFFKLFPAEP
jgi:hypothetical protein